MPINPAFLAQFAIPRSVSGVGPLLHFDGTSGSTSILDAHSGSVWAVNAGAALSSTQAKFGATSLACGPGYINTTNTGVSLAGDFCVEGWAFSSGTPRGLFHNIPSGTSAGLALGRNGGVWEVYHNNVVSQSASLALPSGWFHWAVYRSGTTLVAAINGVVGISVTDSSALGSTFVMYVGVYFNNSFPWVGFIDEFRMTGGSSVYSVTGFTPPTSPFT